MKFYNIFLENILLPIGDFLIGNHFTIELNRMRKITTSNNDELDQIQNNKLQNLLIHATQNSTYYKELNVKSFKDPGEWLKHFPILTKTILHQEQHSILCTTTKHLIKQNSSGSSGVRSTVYWSKKEQSIHRATQVLWWEWAGYKIGTPILQTGLSPTRSFVKYFKDILFRTKYVFAFSFTKDEAEKALLWKNANKNRILGGYASSLFVLSKYGKEINQDINFKAAISWGDKLFDGYRKSITEAFNCPVFETYGTTEGMMIAAQCDKEFMYIMTPNVYLEILDDNGNEVEDGQIGNVVVTNLNGYAMPLIRYKIGDLAIKLPAHLYPPNRKFALPLLQKVIGRDTDIVKTKSGRYMIVHSFTGVFEHISEIKQFRVIQNNLDGIIIEFIKSNLFNPDCLILAKEKILEFLKEDFIITFKEVNSIPNSSSGKPQIIVSNLKN